MSLKFSLLPVLLFSFMLTESNAQDISVDQKLGEEASVEVESTMGVYENKRMTKYITEIGERLISQLDTALFEYNIKLITSSVPNAFALPGGYLYVTTGLIPLIETEDELACIMAHEIIHANNRHAVQSMKKKILPTILQIPGNILGVLSPAAGNVINSPIRAISSIGQASYSRKHETEADTEGATLAAKAGYDPSALKDILSRLAKQTEVTSGQTEEKNFLSDHPYTPDRVTNLEAILSTLTVYDGKPISSNFLKEFDGIIAGDDPAKGVAVGQKFIQPTANFSITMPADWKVIYENKVVAGSQKDDDAVLYCQYDTSSQSPEEASAAFLRTLSSSNKKLILGTQAISINDKPAYMVSFSQNHDEKEIYGFKIWMKMEDLMYSVYAIGFTPFRETLEGIVYTIEPLTEADKKEVMIANLKVVKAENGETLDVLNKRTNNTLSKELSAIINNHKQDDPFLKGEEVKIIVDTPYFK